MTTGDIGKEDGRSRIEEIIRKRTREITSLEFGQLSKEVFTRDCTQRKINAAVHFAPVLRERFGDKYPGTDWEETASLLAVLNTDSPDSIERETHFLYALAFFILDSVYYSGEKGSFSALEKILKNDTLEEHLDEEIYDYYVNKHLLTCYHPLYRPWHVDSIVDLIAFRNLDYISYKKEKRGIGDYSLICDSVTTAFDNPPMRDDGIKLRKEFDAMIALIPQSVMEDAENVFKDLFFRIIDAYLEGRRALEKQKVKLDAQDEYLDYQMEEIDFKDRIEREKSREMLKKIDEMERRRADYNFRESNFDDCFTEGIFSDPVLIDRYSKAFGSIDVEDPYKVVAGYFFLLLKNDDFVWLVSAATAALGYGARLLPWVETEWQEDWDPDFPEEYHIPKDFYKPALKAEDVGYEGYETPTMSAAKFIFFISDTVPPRYTYSFPEREQVRNTFGDELTFELEKSYLSSYHAVHRIESRGDDQLWKMYYDNMEELEAVKGELKSMSGKLSEAESRESEDRRIGEGIACKLRSELESASRTMEKMTAMRSLIEDELEKARREIARLKSEHRAEKEELNTLRELIFENRNENNVMEDEDKGEFRWPYETEKDTVVIGGHPDWINKMHSLLPKVKFYGDRAPDRGSLKHCDVLWFQTKICLSHPTFYKVIEMAKSLHVPICYCRSFGIYSSAEAIAKYDKDHRL